MATYTLTQYAEMFLRQSAGGYVSAEFELTLSDIKAYICTVYPAIMTQHIRAKRAADEDPFSGAEGSWVKVTDCIETEHECDCGVDKYFISLSGIKYCELSNGQGIVSVAGCGGYALTKVNIQMGMRFSALEASSVAAPAFWVEKERIRFTGSIGKVQVWYVPDPYSLSEDEPFPLPADTAAYQALEQMVMAKIQQFLSIPEDTTDDSSETI